MDVRKSLLRGAHILLIALVVVLVALSYYSISNLLDVQRRNAQIAAWRRPLSINHVRITTQDQMFRRYVVQPSSELLQQMMAEQEALMEDAKGFDEFPLTEADRALLLQLEANYRDLASKTRQYLLQENDLEKVSLLQQLLGQNYEAIGTLNRHAEEHYQYALGQFDSQVHTMEWATVGLLGLAALLSLITFRMQSMAYRALSQSDQAEIQLKRAEEEAITDSLTGALNHKYLQKACEDLRQQRRSFSVIMFDVDDFKHVNDKYGHLVGDQVLKHLVRVVAAILRPQDTLCRYGGEEFAIVIRAEHVADVVPLASRVRAVVSETIFPVVTEADEVALQITVSVGISSYDATEQNDVLREADSALYRSKRGGKNRVSLYEADTL